MKASTNLIIVLISLFFVVNAFAETNIKSEVNKSKLTTDQDLTYKITVTSNESYIPLPEEPKFKGFNVLSSDQSSTMSFTKDGIKSTLVRTIILTPLETGKLKIEPSKVTVNNKVHSSQGFEIEVSPGKEKPSLQEEGQPESENPKVTL